MEWLEAITFFRSSKFKEIAGFLTEEKKQGKIILPNNDEILKAFELTPLEKVKVVVLGQDPYPTANPKHAMGLAFSVPSGTKPLPKSLLNIGKELETEFWGERKIRGDLSPWAKQGVLLLNTSLTVVAGQPGSHSGIGWSALTNEVIRFLNDYKENLVFVLWGKHAQNKGMFIDRTKHHVIESPHPSPLSAHRGFFGSKPFTRTNQYLIEHDIEPISW